jgi:hypothetical protein
VQSITVARTARRLREDFELDPHAVSLLLAYLDRIHELEEELCALRAQLPGSGVSGGEGPLARSARGSEQSRIDAGGRHSN